MSKDKHPFERPMVMLDIETMGLKQDSVVWEIGAILFEGYPSLETISDNRWYLHMGDQDERGFNPQTLAWTAKVGGDMRRVKALIRAIECGSSVKDWLASYTSWLHDHWPTPVPIDSPDKVDPCTWVYGPHFDIAMLENLIESLKLGRPPWKYDKPMDCRTLDRLFTLFGGDAEKDPDSVPHDALGDCELQLERLRKGFKLLGSCGKA